MFRKLLITSLAGILVAHPAFADTLATGAVASSLTVDDEFITGLKEATSMAFLPDGRIVVTERAGVVRLFEGDGKEVGAAGTFPASTSFGEKGLLNVAVHPDFETTRTLFFYYTGKGASADENKVVSIKLGTDNKLDMASEKALVSGIAAPLNHDGGGLAVLGKYLFIGTGDSGSNSQARPYDLEVGNYYPTCLTNLNGKVLRLNVDGTIPTDNPLVGKMVSKCGTSTGAAPSGMGEARTEIFAWGFRNAFRVWGDSQTGNLWVGHVGEVTFEMINVVPPTGNKHYGWPFREGGAGFPNSECEKYSPNVGACVDPVYSCEQSPKTGMGAVSTKMCPSADWGTACNNPEIPDSCSSITGGVIFSGCEWPADLRGKYIFGDYTSKKIWTLPVNAERNDVTGERVDFATGTGGAVDFDEYKGALYIVQYSGAKSYVAKVTPNMTPADCTPAPSMSGGGQMMGAPAMTGSPTGGSQMTGMAMTSSPTAGAQMGAAQMGGAQMGGAQTGGAQAGTQMGGSQMTGTAMSSSPTPTTPTGGSQMGSTGSGAAQSNGGAAATATAQAGNQAQAGSMAGSSPTAGSGGGTTTAPANPSSSDDGGCSVRQGNGKQSWSALGLASLAFAFAARRRRQSAS